MEQYRVEWATMVYVLLISAKIKAVKYRFRISIFLNKTPIENMDNRISSLCFSVVSLFPMEQDLVVDAVEDVIEDVLRRGAFGHQGFLDELGALLFHGVDAVDDVLDEVFDVLLVMGWIVLGKAC